MKIFKKYKREVIVGVVVSLITAVLVEGINRIIDIAPEIGPSIIVTIKNMIYSIAATQSDTFLPTLIICGILGALLGQYIRAIFKGFSTLFSSLKLERIVKQSFQGKTDILDESIASIIQANLKKDTDTKSINEIIKSGKQAGSFAIVIFILFVASYAFVILCVVTPSNIYSRFQRDVTMIYPYVNEKSVRQLQSDWVCMRSEADYIEIYEYINEIKVANSLPR